jgi:hypothetical protein
VRLQLVGSKAASPTVPVGGSDDDGDSGLARATAVALELALDADIGQLRRVRVERAPGSTSGTGEGWFLDRIEVVSPAGERLLLPCRAWFGSSDCGDYVGALERNLIPVEGHQDEAGGGASRWAEVVGSAPVDVRAAGVAFPHPEKVIKNQVRGVVSRGFGYGGEDAFFFATGGVRRASAAWAPRQRRSAAAPPDARCTSAAAITGGSESGVGGGEDLSAPSVLPDPLPDLPPPVTTAAHDVSLPTDEVPQFEIPQLSAGAGPAAAAAQAAAAGSSAKAGGGGSGNNTNPALAALAATTGPAAVFGMGVSDGVYMWKEVGIDSGAMSRTLMETSSHMVQAGCEDVLRVLQVAARHVESEGVAGSATACLVTVNKAAARLQAATLGDSGFFVLSPSSSPEGAGAQGGRPQQAATAPPPSSSSRRSSLAPPSHHHSPRTPPPAPSTSSTNAAAAPPGARMAVRYRSPQLEREFGCPYQLGHHAGAQAPEDADLVALPVSPGDVIVMGTDGLLDNLSEAEILREVQQEAAEAAAKRGAAVGGAGGAARRAASASSASAHARGVHHHPTHHHTHLPSTHTSSSSSSAQQQQQQHEQQQSPPPLPPSALISPSALAHRLARLAFEASVDRSRSTPYSRAATEAFDMVYSGGKPDDITVVVAVIGQQQQQPQVGGGARP